MKILSRMLTRKTTPSEGLGKSDLDEDLEPLRRRDNAVADDSGRANPSRPAQGASEPPLAVRSRPIRPKSEGIDLPREPEPEVVAQGWDESDWDDEEWDDDDNDMYNVPMSDATPIAPSEATG